MGSRTEELLSFEEKGHRLLEVTKKAMGMGVVVKIRAREGEGLEFIDHT